jgi:hypothetical protein
LVKALSSYQLINVSFFQEYIAILLELCALALIEAKFSVDFQKESVHFCKTDGRSFIILKLQSVQVRRLSIHVLCLLHASCWIKPRVRQE